MRITSYVQRRGRRGGMIAVQVALCLTALLAVAAIALDVGILSTEQRHGQAAADAAALAGAIDLFTNYAANNGTDPKGTAKASALSTAAANGYNNDGVTSVVTVNIPPKSGQFVGASGYVEVIVQYNQRRGFSNLFGSGPVPVKARAVARGKWTPFSSSILLLDPTSSGALSGVGKGSITVTGGSIVVDSNSPTGGMLNGYSIVSAPEINFSGVPGWSTSGNASFVGTIQSGQSPTPDPLAYLPPPDPNSLPIQSNSSLSYTGVNIVTLNPGVYKGGISIGGQTVVTLNPGIYYMDGGGFSFSGQGSLIGNGVMIYNAPGSSGGAISLTGNGLVNITPMTTGPYQGISIFQDRNSNVPVQVSGNGATAITGTFYAADATLNITGNGAADVIGSQYISYDLSLSGSGSINVNWSGGTARGRFLGLVE